MDELKTCPFCGSPAKLVPRPTFRASTKEREHFIRCTNFKCGADLGVFRNLNLSEGDDLPDKSKSDGGFTKEEVIKAWNTRPTLS